MTKDHTRQTRKSTPAPLTPLTPSFQHPAPPTSARIPVEESILQTLNICSPVQASVGPNTSPFYKYLQPPVFLPTPPFLVPLNHIPGECGFCYPKFPTQHNSPHRSNLFALQPHFTFAAHPIPSPSMLCPTPPRSSNVIAMLSHDRSPTIARQRSLALSQPARVCHLTCMQQVFANLPASTRPLLLPYPCNKTSFGHNCYQLTLLDDQLPGT